jgi:membrane associated rhomboid family serine protease
VLFLIVANMAILLLSQNAPGLIQAFGLVPALILVRPWTVITYMFLHAGISHLFWNMLALYFFGPRLEARIGGRRFIGLYLTSGIAGAIASLVTPYALIIGASGAVFGVMLGYAHYWPREPIYLFFLIRIEARWLLLLMTAMALWGGLSPGSSGIANFAHLGGFLGGFLYLRWMELRSPAVQFRARAKVRPPPRSSGADLERWRRIQTDTLHPVNREEYERVMAKVALMGAGGLTPDERAFLDRFSAH